MTETRHCPECGGEIPSGSPAGVCPKCLLRAGLNSEAADGPDFAPTQPSPAATRATFVPPTVDELAGRFPQLEILELLGQGGMGAVYKARQPGLDRLVAVKILPPEISHDPAFAERFQREARALARLSHPHIVAVYDFGETAGLCYIVMEFVDGANLRQAMRTGTLTSAEALAIVPQICEALQFAHDEGIVHRDIKPENILIDKRGRVKIADFGLAKLLGADAGDHSLTATHQVMGTLRYMAPEQMQGSREVDHRADIYSLGVVFYELLTGELPMGKFAPPSKKVQVDVRLDEIVLRALEQEPEQRYQHASEIKVDVENVTSRSDTNGVLSNQRPSVHTAIPGRWEAALQSWWLVQSSGTRQALFIALNCLCVFCLFAFFTFNGKSDTDGNHRYEVGFLDPWLVIDRRVGPGLRSESGIILAWSWLFGIGAYGSGWLLFKLKRDPHKSPHVGENQGTGPDPTHAGTPLTQMRFLVAGSANVAQQAIFHFSALGYRLIEQRADVCVFQRGGQWAGLWETDIRKIATRLTVRTAPAADCQRWVSCDWSVRTLGAWITRRDIRQLEAEGDGFKSLLGVALSPELQSADSQPEPRLSRCALIGAVWAGLGFPAAIILTLAISTTPKGTTLGGILHIPVPLFALFAMSAPIGATILGAVAITRIKRSEGKLYGLRLAQADALFFPMLLLAALAGLAGTILLRGPLRSSGLDESIFWSPQQEVWMAVIALPIWFFPARALWRAVVGPRDAFAIRNIPLVSNEPLTGKAALVLAAAAIAAHALSWHWIIMPPPSSRSLTISNADVIDAWQSLWLLVLSIGLALFASAASLARPAKMILRIGSVMAALVALVIQVQFFRSLGEFEPGRVEKVVRLTRTYSHMGVYVTIALTGLAILFFVLRLFEEKSEHPDSQARIESDDVQNSEPRLSRLALWGAIWGGLGLIGLIVAVFLTSFDVRDSSGQSSASPESLRILGWVIVTVAVALGASSIFGMTICGAVAIGHIKHSGGKLYGLRLAAADTLLFPLLVLGGITVALTHFICITVWTNWPAPVATVQSSGDSPPRGYPGESFMIFDAIAALVVCFFVGRAAWRAIVGRSDSARRGSLTPPLPATEDLPGATNAQETFGRSSGSVGDQPQPANHSNGIGRISLWTAIAGVVLPVLLALGAQLMAPSQRLSDFFVLCVVLGGFLELVAFGCGIASRRTGSGKAGIFIASISLVLWLLIALTSINSSGPSELDSMESISRVPAAVPPLGNITSGIGAEFTVPAGQVAVFEIVTRRDSATVPVPPHCGYIMAPPDSPVAGTFRWSRKPEEDIAVGRSRKWSLEIVTGGGGSGYSEGILLPDELNAAVGSRRISLGLLAPNEEAVHWGVDANGLPANGLIGLRVTVVSHGMKTGGSGNAHIDWKKAQSAQSTTRRKLPDVAP